MKQQALMAALALGATAAPVQGQTQQASQRPTIVLVHGGFVDGSGWEGVFKRLRKNGYNVTIVQNPTISLSDDVAADAPRHRGEQRPGDPGRPFVRWRGHHGSRQRPEGRGTRLHRGLRPRQRGVGREADCQSRAGSTRASVLPPQDGFLSLDKAKFAAAFAADVDPSLAEFMAQSQVPWGLDALNGEVTQHRGGPSRAGTSSRPMIEMIPPAAQRFMSKRAVRQCASRLEVTRSMCHVLLRS